MPAGIGRLRWCLRNARSIRKRERWTWRSTWKPDPCFASAVRHWRVRFRERPRLRWRRRGHLSGARPPRGTSMKCGWRWSRRSLKAVIRTRRSRCLARSMRGDSFRVSPSFSVSGCAWSRLPSKAWSARGPGGSKTVSRAWREIGTIRRRWTCGCASFSRPERLPPSVSIPCRRARGGSMPRCTSRRPRRGKSLSALARAPIRDSSPVRDIRTVTCSETWSDSTPAWSWVSWVC